MTSATAGTAHHHDAYRESRLGSRRDGPAVPAASFSASCTGPVLADVVLISRAPIALVVVFAGVGMWWAMSVDVGGQEVWSQAASIASRTTSGVACPVNRPCTPVPRAS